GGRLLTANVVPDGVCTTHHITVLGFDAHADLEAGQHAHYHDREPATVRDDRRRDVAPHRRWHSVDLIHATHAGTPLQNWPRPPRGLVEELLMLHYEQGHQHFERPSVNTPAPQSRQVVSFPGLPDDVRSGMIEIPSVVVQQRTDETLTVPVPGETEVRFLGCEATVSTTRTSGDPRPRVSEPR